MGVLSRNFAKKKVSGNFPDCEERWGGKKSKKKKKEKKNFLWDVFPCGFPSFGDKKGEKNVIGFVFFNKGRGKM